MYRLITIPKAYIDTIGYFMNILIEYVIFSWTFLSKYKENVIKMKKIVKTYKKMYYEN